jgi:hypothetical protein
VYGTGSNIDDLNASAEILKACDGSEPLVHRFLKSLHIGISGMDYNDDRKQDLSFLKLVLAFCVKG